MLSCFTDKVTDTQRVVICPCEFMKDLVNFSPHFPQCTLAVLRTLTYIFYHLKDLLYTKDSQIHISSQELFSKLQIHIPQVPAEEVYSNVSHILKFNMFKVEFTIFSPNPLFSLWSMALPWLLKPETWTLILLSLFCPQYPINNHFFNNYISKSLLNSSTFLHPS